MKPESMDAVFHALAHRTRRAIMDIVQDNPGCSVVDVCAHFDISRVAVLKHIGVLETAHLVLSEKQGRVRELYLNTVPLQQICDRWTNAYSRLWASHITAIKYRLEA